MTFASLVAPLSLRRPEDAFEAWLCLLEADLSQLRQVLREEPFLHPQEDDYYRSLPAQSRKSSYLAGRWCAKQVLSAASIAKTPASNILIENGVFMQPVVCCGATPGQQVSISHGDAVAAALEFDERHPMGIDIERPSQQHQRVMSGQITSGERLLLLGTGLDETELGCTWLWTVKEALGKALKTGLTVPLGIYELQNVSGEGRFVVTTFRNFGQFKCLSFCWRGAVISVALPWKSELRIDECAAREIDPLPASSFQASGNKSSMRNSRLAAM